MTQERAARMLRDQIEDTKIARFNAAVELLKEGNEAGALEVIRSGQARIEELRAQFLVAFPD